MSPGVGADDTLTQSFVKKDLHDVFAQEVNKEQLFLSLHTTNRPANVVTRWVKELVGVPSVKPLRTGRFRYVYQSTLAGSNAQLAKITDPVAFTVSPAGLLNTAAIWLKPSFRRKPESI
ncbi:MAG: hypothetical protein OQJ84_06490 [Xanthomonadales bacterium]|nr:hypothetical protein [Xanthomonadales bacterium]